MALLPKSLIKPLAISLVAISVNSAYASSPLEYPLPSDFLPDISVFYSGNQPSSINGVDFHWVDINLALAKVGGGTFDLTGATLFSPSPWGPEFTQSWTDVFAYRNGVQISPTSSTCAFGEATYCFKGTFDQAMNVSFDLKGIDLVVFRANAMSDGETAIISNIQGNNLLAPVPEPETWAITLAGLGVLGTVLRKRKTTQA